MGGKDNLYVGIKFQTEVDQSLLPLDVERNLGFVHKEYIGLIVLYQYREQYGEYLFLAARQLVRQQHLAYLSETEFVFGTDNLLARFAEQFINYILET